MSLVSVHNEWDPLEEVIIGTMRGARTPRAGRDLFTIEFHRLGKPDNIPSGPYPQRVVEETEEELTRLGEALSMLGITVRRPGPRDPAATFSTPDWESDGYYDYCPRDCLLAVGDIIIETPMVLRSRFLEPFAYRDLLIEYFESGARWLSAPKPRLTDELYRPEKPMGRRLGNLEPIFDAANILRFGTDLLYLISDSGNDKGCRWLQSVLGASYTVHPCRGLYAATHVDSTIVPLREGLVLLNPKRVNDENFPAFLKGWERVWCPEPVDIGYAGSIPRASRWIAMNLLVVRPGLVIADDRQRELITTMAKYNIDVLPLRLTHAQTLGGGFHCVSLDVRRSGSLQTHR
jgi:scyllo-inosamine-4-phosphate amidinotransferase 1